MTRAEIDILWQRAMQQAVADGEMFTRYHFARLVADGEREACAKAADEYAGCLFVGTTAEVIAAAIRARESHEPTAHHP